MNPTTPKKGKGGKEKGKMNLPLIQQQLTGRDENKLFFQPVGRRESGA